MSRDAFIMDSPSQISFYGFACGPHSRNSWKSLKGLFLTPDDLLGCPSPGQSRVGEMHACWKGSTHLPNTHLAASWSFDRRSRARRTSNKPIDTDGDQPSLSLPHSIPFLCAVCRLG